MQISTLLSLLICFNAAQATAIRRENRYGYGSVRHRPDYEHNEENDRRPVGGPQPPATTMTGTTKMVGGAATERPQAIVTIRPTITVNPVTTITSQDAITMTSQDTTTTTTTTTTATATADQLATASTTVTQPATSTQTADPAFSSVALQRHNIHRSNHSAPDATWNTDLAGYAKTVADGCKFEHDITPGGGNYGQNLAIQGSTDPNLATADNRIYLARAITNQWYNGEFGAFLPSYYGDATPDLSNFGAWGHFSQVVWSASAQIGCATSFCPAGTAAALASWFTVCDYISAGNVGGEYGSNIGQPVGRAVVTAP